MKTFIQTSLSIIAAATVSALLSTLPLEAGPPVKVFILAGQSNMEGAGKVEGDANRNEGKGSLSYLAENDPKYKHLGSSGKWVERDDVSIWYLGRKGKLAPGFGARGSSIGPELGFGHVVGDAFDEPVLLIKTAWGGKSLAKDFRPPSSGGEVGPFYTEMFTHVKTVLENLKKEFPKYRSGYEIAGFGWHQGWNDGCDMAMKELTAAATPREPEPAPMHRFRSADGSKTFKGQLQSYDAATKKVTVRREDGKVIRFDLDHLHSEDQEFVTSGGEEAE